MVWRRATIWFSAPQPSRATLGAGRERLYLILSARPRRRISAVVAGVSPANMQTLQPTRLPLQIYLEASERNHE